MRFKNAPLTILGLLLPLAPLAVNAESPSSVKRSVELTTTAEPVNITPHTGSTQQCTPFILGCYRIEESMTNGTSKREGYLMLSNQEVVNQRNEYSLPYARRLVYSYEFDRPNSKAKALAKSINPNPPVAGTNTYFTLVKWNGQSNGGTVIPTAIGRAIDAARDLAACHVLGEEFIENYQRSLSSGCSRTIGTLNPTLSIRTDAIRPDVELSSSTKEVSREDLEFSSTE